MNQACLSVAVAGAALALAACSAPSVHLGDLRQDGPLRVTSVPRWCDLADLAGTVEGVEHPEELGVAVYLQVDGRWWSKPTRAAPVTPVSADGSWRVDVTTGGSDAASTGFVVFLLPRDFTVPIAQPMGELPPGLLERAIARVGIARGPRPGRTIQFAGREWSVRDSRGREAGPGPNTWRGTEDAVWVDDRGRLHLALTRVDGRWHAAEVRTRVPGHGRYTFEVAQGPPDDQPAAILGLFTYDFQREPRRELDVELGRWGDPEEPDLQFVVQPWQRPGNRVRFAPSLGAGPSNHTIEWTGLGVRFVSSSDIGGSRAEFTYQGPGIPGPGPLSAVLNLWPARDGRVVGDRPVEIVITRFEHAAVTAAQHLAD